MVGNKQREALWREHVEQWRASRLSQRAFAGGEAGASVVAGRSQASCRTASGDHPAR